MTIKDFPGPAKESEMGSGHLDLVGSQRRVGGFVSSRANRTKETT